MATGVCLLLATWLGALGSGIVMGQAISEGWQDLPLPNQSASQTISEESNPHALCSDPSAEEESANSREPEHWYEKFGIRGYVQTRYNYVTHLADFSAPPHHAGDSSVSENGGFLIRRARLIVSGDVSDHLFIYVQPDFANSPNGSVDSIYFGQLRDCYGDVFLDSSKVHRFRIGQSKVPYGWENMQSSQNRIAIDRNDALNSATRNERDLGVYYYWTPTWAQDIFKFIDDNRLKGSGNYGIFGIGVVDGQGGSSREQNSELHWLSRLTFPWADRHGQLREVSIQGYTGRYVPLGSPISPMGVGPAIQPLGTLGNSTDGDGILDQRIAWTYVRYPQPLGFQAEYTIGRGPTLNDSQTEIERGFLHGGYWMFNYRWHTHAAGEFWAFARYQYFRGGYKNAINAPAAEVSDWSIGFEWQFQKSFELVTEYLLADRTNLTARPNGLSYDQFVGHVLRFQFQFNF